MLRILFTVFFPCIIFGDGLSSEAKMTDHLFISFLRIQNESKSSFTSFTYSIFKHSFVLNAVPFDRAILIFEDL